MTIIKVAKDGKSLLKKKPDDTVVPLTPGTGGERVLQIQMSVPNQRSRRCMNVFLLLIALMVLSAGIVGSIFLFKHLSHKHSNRSRVTVHYTNPESPGRASSLQGNPDSKQPVQSGYLTMEEEIDIEIDEEIERIEVPQFDECLRSVIVHDFFRNITAIVDNDDKECFLMDLDRTKMKPPRSFAELVRLYATGYYMPNVSVVRRQYTIQTPALTDMSFAGTMIRSECFGYNTYKLIKKEYEDVPAMSRFEVRVKLMKTYGYTDLNVLFKDQIYK